MGWVLLHLPSSSWGWEEGELASHMSLPRLRGDGLSYAMHTVPSRCWWWLWWRTGFAVIESLMLSVEDIWCSGRMQDRPPSQRPRPWHVRHYDGWRTGASAQQLQWHCHLRACICRRFKFFSTTRPGGWSTAWTVWGWCSWASLRAAALRF